MQMYKYNNGKLLKFHIPVSTADIPLSMQPLTLLCV
jgi:hypothetical protein